jgi:hypothetical protein
MSARTKVVKVKASAGWLFRPLWESSTEKKLEKTINEWQKEGYKLLNTVPATDKQGNVTEYLLTFEKQ